MESWQVYKVVCALTGAYGDPMIDLPKGLNQLEIGLNKNKSARFMAKP